MQDELELLSHSNIRGLHSKCRINSGSRHDSRLFVILIELPEVIEQLQMTRRSIKRWLPSVASVQRSTCSTWIFDLCSWCHRLIPFMKNWDASLPPEFWYGLDSLVSISRVLARQPPQLLRQVVSKIDVEWLLWNSKGLLYLVATLLCQMCFVFIINV